MTLFNVLRGLWQLTLGRKRRDRLPRRQRRRSLSFEVLEDRLCLTGDLLVSSFLNNQVLAFDGSTGASLGTFASGGGLLSPVGIAIGPDNNVYVSGRDNNAVLRYDGTTGAFLDDFVGPHSAGLSGPHELLFSNQGDLLVNSGFNSNVLFYDGTSGAFQNVQTGSGIGGLSFPHGLAEGPDGNLYVGDRNTNEVLKFNGSTGAFQGVFVAAGSGGLNVTTGVAFGPDGNLYVDSFNTNNVLRYNGSTGAFMDVFASGGGLSGPQGLVFGPDGNLYVSSFNTNQVLRYNGSTGAFMDVFASGGGLDGPTYLAFQRTATTTALTVNANPAVFSQPLTFTATVTPVSSGLVTPTGGVRFTIDGVPQPIISLVNGQASFSTAALGVGSHTVTVTYLGDNFFNASSGNLSETVNPDGTNTTVASSANPAVFGQTVTLTATVSAASPGAATPTGTVSFAIDGGAPQTVALSGGSATYTTSELAVGNHTVSVAYGGDGNFSGSTASFTQAVNKADTSTGLTSSLNPSVFGQTVTLTATLNVTAPGVGTPSGTFTFLDGNTVLDTENASGGTATFTTSALAAGSHSLTVIYSGDGNFNGSTSALLTQAVIAADTTTTLTSSANPSVFGQTVTFTATVSTVAPGVGTPVGTVTFTIDNTTQTVALNNGQATVNLASLSVGSHTVTAAYNGVSNFNPSTSTALTQTVNLAPTSTALSSSAAPAVFGQTVTFTATVTAPAPGVGTPTGTITFTVDGTPQTAVNLSNGQATLTVSGFGVGSHTIQAVYNGDGHFSGSTAGNFTEIVNKADTTTTLSSSQASPVFGQSVTFTATVNVTGPGAGTTTGTITFLDGNTILGTSAVSGGTATFTTAALAAGSHSITAEYSGDGNFKASTSAALTQSVLSADTATTLTSSANPSAFGQTVTFTATVTTIAPGVGTPIGTVTFTIDGTTQTVSLTNGQASFSTAALGAGSHNVTAAFDGATSFNVSTPATLTQVVANPSTGITLTSSANPSVFGQKVTFTAMMTGPAPDGGMVTFSDGSTVLGTGTLSGGTATFSTSGLTPGTHPITAKFNGSTSSVLAQTVLAQNSVTTVTSSANPSVFGEKVTFMARVTSSLGTTARPTGTVIFTIDGVAQAPIKVWNGQASLSVSTLKVGKHTVTATYSGDGFFNPSTSASLVQRVNKDETGTALAMSSSSVVSGGGVTFTARVGAWVPGSGTPTGTVTFLIDGKARGRVKLARGKAHLTIAMRSAGWHHIRVIYSGDADFVRSSSADLRIHVLPHHNHHEKEDHDGDRDDH
jgi:hypothetical protein